MKIKLKDLQLAMAYMEKELVETLYITLSDNIGLALKLEFVDAEKRDCVISLFSTDAGTTPEITKRMKLYDRVVKK